MKFLYGSAMKLSSGCDTGEDIMMLHEVESNLENPANLSNHREATINNVTKLKKKTNPVRVRKIRIFPLLVAAL